MYVTFSNVDSLEGVTNKEAHKLHIKSRDNFIKYGAEST